MIFLNNSVCLAFPSCVRLECLSGYIMRIGGDSASCGIVLIVGICGGCNSRWQHWEKPWRRTSQWSSRGCRSRGLRVGGWCGRGRGVGPPVAVGVSLSCTGASQTPPPPPPPPPCMQAWPGPWQSVQASDSLAMTSDWI